jgi:predicted RNase H-like HicB family nuclease
MWMARLLGWTECVTEGSTREEALQNLEQRLTEELAEAELTQLEIPLSPPENPWLKVAGSFKDDAQWDEYQAELAAERQQDYEETMKMMNKMESEGNG